MEALLTSMREYWSVSGQKIEKLETIDCNQVLGQVLEILKLPLEETGGKVTHDPLPKIAGEAHPLRLLFQNLISNALKYGHPERPPEIHISAKHQDAAWMFSVADNGAGIDAKDFETIFTPFKRLHRGAHPGTGLGLAMCRRIVERYQGKIWVTSTKDKGSTFEFTTPDSGAQV